MIAHGLYSWVSPELREALLGKVAEWLAPEGIGYLSHNVYPGSYVRDAARAIGLKFARDNLDPEDTLKALRAVATAFSASIASERPLAQAIKGELSRILAASDSQVAHDWFEANNQPVHFGDFARHLERFGLTFLAESSLPPGAAQNSSNGQKLLARLARDVVKREACLDVLTCNAFRQSLVSQASALTTHRVDQTLIRSLSVGTSVSVEGAHQTPSGALGDLCR